MTIVPSLLGYPFTIDTTTEKQWLDLRAGRMFRNIAMSDDAHEA